MAKRKENSARDKIMKCDAYKSGRKWTIARMAAQTNQRERDVRAAVTDMRAHGELVLVAKNLKGGRHTCYYAKPASQVIRFVTTPIKLFHNEWAR